MSNPLGESTPVPGQPGTRQAPLDMETLHQSLQESIAATRTLSLQFAHFEKELAQIKAADTVRTAGYTDVTATPQNFPATPRVLRPGVAPGPGARPGQTPFPVTPVARGVSGFFVPITPKKAKDDDASGTIGIGLDTKDTGGPDISHLDSSLSSDKRLEASRRASDETSTEVKLLKAELWSSCRAIVESDNSGATADEIVSKTERMVADQWLQLRRERILQAFKTDGNQSLKTIIGDANTMGSKKEWQRKISQSAPGRVINKLTHGNYMAWASEIIAILAPIQGATEILEGLKHGRGYLESNLLHETEDYHERLDLEIGGLIAGSVTDECRGYVVTRQTRGEYRGSILWRDLVTIMRSNDGVGKATILEKVLSERQKGTEGVRSYAERLRTLFIGSAAINAPFSDEDQVLYLLRGLSRHFDTARATIRGFQNQGQLYTFDRALTYLVREEAAMNHDQHSSRLPLLSRPSVSLATDSETSDKSDASKASPRRFHVLRNTAVKGQPGWFNGECRECRRWGHKAEDCARRKRAIDAGTTAPTQASAKVALSGIEEEAGDSEQQALSDEEGDIFELVDENGEVFLARLATAQIGDKDGEASYAKAMVAVASHAAATDPTPRMRSPEELEAFAALYIPEKAVKWILDSGATHHMTHMPEILPVRTGAKSDAVVHTANGSTAKISRRGACIADVHGDGGSTATAFLKTVLVVPAFTNNLLSVQRLTDDGWTVQFSKRGAELTSPEGDKVQTFTEPGTGAPYLMLKSQSTRVIDIKGSSKRVGPARAVAQVAAGNDLGLGEEAEVKEDKGLAKEVKDLEIWHKRLGHMGDSFFRALVQNPAFKREDRPSLRAVSEYLATRKICDACIEAKQPLLRFDSSDNEAPAKMSDIHFDLSGPYEGNKDYKIALHIIDSFSRMSWTFPLPNKEASTVFGVFEEWATLMGNQGHGAIKRLHCDHGREFENHLFQDWARKQGIAWNFAVPGTSQQNGLIERWNRTVQDRARAMLRAAHLSDAFWPFAFRAASHLLNMSPSSAIGSQIPLKRWSDDPIDYDSCRVFGCLCWAIKSAKTRKNKLSTRAVRASYLGPAPEHKAHLVYVPSERPHLRIIRHCIFDESRMYDARFTLDEKQEHVGGEGDTLELVAPKRTIRLSEVPVEQDFLPLGTPVLDLGDEDDAEEEQEGRVEDAVAAGQKLGDNEGTWPTLDSMFGDEEDAEDLVTNEWDGNIQRVSSPEWMGPSTYGIRNSYPAIEGLGSPITLDYLEGAFTDTPTKTTIEPTVGAITQPPPEPRRSSRIRAQFKALTTSVQLVLAASVGEELLQRAQAFAAWAFGAAVRSSSDGVLIEPKTLAEAKKRADWLKWEQGMKAEITSLNSMKTWTLTELPPGRKAIGCRWTYKLKLDTDGRAVRWKARLVAQGFSQRAGVDYNETFAPVARLATIRIIVALAVRHKLKIWSMDVVTAFLNGSISEDIYMTQPPHFDDGTGRVCKLHRSLYGLKQSGREWFVVIVTWLLKQKFQALQSEPCVFVKIMPDGELVIIVLYVDDVLIAAKKQSTIDYIRKSFTLRFNMTDNGALTQVLGLKININHDIGIATISQEAYIDGIIQRFGLDKANPVDTPMTMALQALGPRVEGQAAAEEIFEYASLVGCLMWAAQGTRPDIAYSVSRLGRFMANPREEHMVGAKRILRYLKGSKSIGLIYSAGHNVQIEGFGDADHAKDLATRRSVSGYAFFIHGNLVSWRSRLQATVTISSTESEYMAMSEAAREAKWLRTFTTEFGFSPRRATDIYTDSSGAYSLARNPEGHNKMKHVDTHHHYVRELVASQQVNITQIGTADNAADILTKVTTLAGLHSGMLQLGLGDNRRATA